MKRFLRNNGLSLTAFALFAIFLFGQSVTGHRQYNADQLQHHESEVSYARYLTTGAFVEATFENWESEFLQMGAYVLLTAWLLQRGSPESRPLGKSFPQDEDPATKRRNKGAPWPVRRGGLALALYRHSLSLAFFALFIGAWLGHAAGGSRDYSAEQQAHGDDPVTMAQYVTTSRFWFESFQNWQSEFLAVGAIVVLSVFLREHRSPESKPVAASHQETAAA
jgi:hypothetical protein